MKILITGGAGFIGSHTADGLLARGYDVRVLDSLEEPVQRGHRKPSCLDERTDYQVFNVGDKAVTVADNCESGG